MSPEHFGRVTLLFPTSCRSENWKARCGSGPVSRRKERLQWDFELYDTVMVEKTMLEKNLGSRALALSLSFSLLMGISTYCQALFHRSKWPSHNTLEQERTRQDPDNSQGYCDFLDMRRPCMQMNLFPGPGSRPSPLIRCHMGDMTSPQIAAEAANIDSLEPQNLTGLLIFSTLCKVGRLSSMVSDKTLHIPLTLFSKAASIPQTDAA